MTQTTHTNRRQFLALTLAMTGAGVLVLTGCGGGGGNGGGGSTSAGFVTRRFAVQLPAGFTLPLTSLVAEAGKASATLDANGAFSVQTPNSDVPALAMLRDKSGRGVLVGFLPASGAAATITTASAAVALLYYALGGFMLPEPSRRPLVAILETDAATVTLAATISQRMLASPYVLEGDDSAVNAALKASVDALTGSGKAIRTTTFAAALTRSRAAATVAPLLQVQPSTSQSGLEIVQGTGTTVTVVNHDRRFCQVFVYETGTPDALPKAILQGDPISLPSTNSLGVFSTINNLVSGQTAYVPVSTNSITLPLASGSTKTLYEIIVVGASSNDLPRGFYSDPKYVDEQAKWVQAQSDLSTLTWWQNLILPIFFEALGIAGLAATTAAVESSLAAIKAIGDASVVQILANAGKGNLLAAASDFWSLAAESTAVGGKVRQALLPLYEAAVGQVAAETAAARLALFAKLVVRAAIAAVVLIGTGDIAAVGVDMSVDQPAEQWFATVFQPTLILSPTAQTIAPGQRVTFSVKPPVGTVGTISYAWTQTGATSTLSSSDGVVGNSITTSSTSVDLVTTPSDSGTITVTVVATLTDAGGHTSELDTAQAAITINSSISYANATPQIVSVSATSGPNAGERALYAVLAVSPPSGPWTFAQMMQNQGYPTNLDGPLGPYLSRADYDAGAPTPGADGGWTPYGYARNGNGNWYNLGGNTLGYVILSSGYEGPDVDVDASRPALQKALDAILSPKTEFS